MSLLSQLLKTKAPPATVATPATQATESSNISKISSTQSENSHIPAEQERRRLRVLSLLNQPGDHRYSILTDDTASADHIIVAIAIRGVASFEMLIPRDRWNPFLFLQYLEGIDHAAH